MERRRFLKAVGGLFGAAAGARLAGLPALEADGAPARAREPAGHPRKKGRPSTPAVEGLRTAEWVVEENRRPGVAPGDWVIPPGPPAGWPSPIEGYLDQVSYQRGDEATLYVNTAAKRFHFEVLRVGYYRGDGARRLATSAELRGRSQPLPQPRAGVNLIECAWTPSARLEIGRDWPPGAYLILLVSSRGDRRYVPFTVRDDSSHAAYVVQSSVTTWQAYNLYGGYDLYGGAPTGALADRARIVSFDRPYRGPDPEGSGDFVGNELPFVYLVERLGLDVTYWTDVDLHARPHLLANHRALFSLGHDEYWSWQMRFNGAMDALAKGVNLAFLGANACYRQIRLQPSSKGVANRQVVCYKDAAEDPMTKRDPRLATGPSWATDPVPYPESELIGSMYQSYGATAPLVVADASSFVFAGTGLHDGDVVHGVPGAEVVGSEFDGFEPGLSGPKNVQILAHSPVESVSGRLISDMTYYTRPGGGGVFASGTARLVQLLWHASPQLDGALSFGPSPAQPFAEAVAINVLQAFGAGPAAKHHPSIANWRRFYSPSAAPVGSVDVGGST